MKKFILLLIILFSSYTYAFAATVRIARANNTFNTAATWGLVDSTSFLDSEAGAQVVTTAYTGTRSTAFTPGAIEIDGIAVKLDARTGITGTMSVELWNATDSIAVPGTEATIRNNGGAVLFL